MAMDLNTTPNLTNTDILTLIETARSAEKYREIQKLQEILQEVWDDIDTEPDYEKYEPPVKAELYRLSGAFLTLYASSRLLKDVHLRAKDLLTKSLGVFEQLNLREKVGEAKLCLGFAYGNCGEIEEYEAYFDSIEEEFEPNHPIQFRVISNRLRICELANKNEEAEKLLEKHSHRFADCADLAFKAILHNNAGIIYRRGKDFDAAADHFNKAVELSRETGILVFEAINHNNLALLYRDQGEFEDAHASAQNALRIFKEINERGSIPKILDTEALIFLAENNYERALQSVEEALQYFLEGEDYNCITDSYWTKILCLLRLDRSEDAYIEFGTLLHIAAKQIGEVAVKKFARLMRDEAYVPSMSLPLPDRIKAFTKHYAKRGLLQNNLKVTKTAYALGFNHHEGLRKILKKFPVIYDELGMPRPKARISKKKKAASKKVPYPALLDPEFIRNDYSRNDDSHLDPSSKIVSLTPDKIREEKIFKVHSESKEFSFDFDFEGTSFETFYFDENMMTQFGIDFDAVIAVESPTRITTGIMVLVKHNAEFIAGRVEFDTDLHIYFISGNDSMPIPLDQSKESSNIVGKLVAFCPANEINNPSIKFTRLKFT